MLSLAELGDRSHPTHPFTEGLHSFFLFFFSSTFLSPLIVSCVLCFACPNQFSNPGLGEDVCDKISPISQHFVERIDSVFL